MLCPFCKKKNSSVVDSRPTEEGAVIRRRRVCGCERKERFTTFERVQFRELTVVKRNGQRSPFDRDKIIKSVSIALRKRPVDTEIIEKFVSKIYRNIEEIGQSEVYSHVIGKMVMDGLKELDQIAYIRFASVYTNFRNIKDFEQFVDKLDEGKNK